MKNMNILVHAVCGFLYNGVSKPGSVRSKDKLTTKL